MTCNDINDRVPVFRAVSRMILVVQTDRVTGVTGWQMNVNSSQQLFSS